MDHSPRFLKLVETTRSRIREVTPEEIEARLARSDDFILIDVREDHEWLEGRIKSACHLGRGVLERDIERMFPDLDTELVLYCGGGFRSALAAESLQKMGYTRVASLQGGFRDWKAQGRPLG